MDVRKAFLEYFESKGHSRAASAPLVPDDATLLFNNAGMVPFKSIFTGEIPAPENPRVTSCQTCLRAGGKHNDLENVGHTARHHTFFEMLGNFSFGDYFKEEAIAYAWEFITEVLELPVEKLWVTVHESDDEAEEIWKKYVAADRIMRLGDKDNFWQMGDTGPCGPCSEIFFDQGAENFSGPEDYMGGEGDRFLEIWNLVFMQYERAKDGTLTPLPKPSIDTGMGLERVVAVKEGALSNYDTSLFMPIINKVAELTGKEYVYKSGASFRVIADHIRTAVFLLSQDVNFSNEGRGYVLRRILRRAVRHGYLLGLNEAFMYKLVDTLVEQMKEIYPYLETKAEAVKTQIELEEERFFKTIASGIELFNAELAHTKDVFSGEVAFKLYDTFGFPLDLTEDMLKEKGLKLDSETFERLMSEQRSRAKAAWKGSGDAAIEGDFKTLLEKFGKNSFSGYEKREGTSKVLALLSEDFKIVDELHSRHKGWVLLDNTPFYAESGGQIGDRGELAGFAKVVDTRKFFDLNLSEVETTALLKTGEAVTGIVDISRLEVEKHHSATHLLHAALYDVLGDHISQAGSSNDAARLRFDFSHPKAMSTEEIAAVEEQVNHQILRGIERVTKEMDIEEAKNSGAKAQFGEKYGDKVRVVSFGDASVELCGGTHVTNTSSIGTFIITKESGVSAGVRRIEAVCGNAAYNLFKEQRHTLNTVAEEVKNRDVVTGVTKLKEQVKTLREEVQDALNASKEELKAEEINGVAVYIEELKSGDVKTRIDELKNKHDSVAAMLFQVKGDKVIIAAGVKEANAKAGDWIKKIAPILGGGGGGRPDFAQAGGKDASKLPEAKAAALDFVKEALS
ncbi:alanine--tRNA ligase [Sulfurimonas sp. HSL3-7]|uniref:alanine--tRNA ligase n=1 Tax=Sulfonitrofixus jiaomeiensis TaxID=3131938 RepID=UPI0031F9ACE4